MSDFLENLRAEQESYERLHLDIRDGKVYAPVQGEVEMIALHSTLGTHHRIFFEPTPLGEDFFLVWCEEALAWELISKRG